MMDELTFDPGSCLSKFAVSKLAGRQTPPEATLTTEAQSATNMGGQHSDGASSYDTYWAALQAWIEDPAFIVTTKTDCLRYWVTDGSWQNTHNWYWFTGSGWSRFSSGVVNSGTTCNTRGAFENWAFGNADLATYANHSVTKVVSNPYGNNWSWTYTMDKWGEKSNWLSYHSLAQSS